MHRYLSKSANSVTGVVQVQPLQKDVQWVRERIDPHSRGKTTLQRHETAIGEQAPLPLCAGFLRGLKWPPRANMNVDRLDRT